MAAERTRSLALAIALALAPLAAPETARAWCQMTSSQRAAAIGECIRADPPDVMPLAWRVPCTSISLSRLASRDLPEDDVRAVFQGAIDAWTTADCGAGRTPGLSVRILPELNDCTESSHHVGRPNVNSVMFVSEGWIEDRGHRGDAYAVTLVWHSRRTGEIWDVDMEINEARGAYGICPDEGCPFGTVDLANVITHEMGHYFGLSHTPDDPLATMWATAESREVLKRDLAEDDVEGICAVYDEGALSGACDDTPRGGLDLTCTTPMGDGEGSGGGCSCSVPGAESRPAPLGLLGLLGLVAARLARRRAR